MATNAQLTGSVIMALNASSLTASGSFVTADGYQQSESVNLTSLMTATATASVQALLTELEMQYQILRQNLLPATQCFFGNISFASSVNNAELVVSTTYAFAGPQALLVTTPGVILGEGVNLNLGSAPKSSPLVCSLTCIVPNNQYVTLTLLDTANQSSAYVPVSPATNPPSYTVTSVPLSASAYVRGTGTWQTITATLPSTGFANTPSIQANLVTAAKTAGLLVLGAVSLT